MNKKQIKDYIKKLKELDSKIGSLDKPNQPLDENFTTELEKVLYSLNKDIENNLAKKVQKQPILNVNFKKLEPNAVTPAYSKYGDAGLDLTATSIISNTTFVATYGTGISVEIPEGYVGLVFPRSSISNYDLYLTNSVGVIDSGYRGEIILKFGKTNGLDSFKYLIGDRIGQLVIIPYPKINLIEVTELTKTDRNTGGFGHTGK